MSSKCQIVPDLAAAVLGATEEILISPESPSLECGHTRFVSLTNSSNDFQVPLSRVNSRTMSQVNAKIAFTYFDKNRDGKLSIKEFKSVMHDLGYKTVDKQLIRQMFSEINEKKLVSIFPTGSSDRYIDKFLILFICIRVSPFNNIIIFPRCQCPQNLVHLDMIYIGSIPPLFNPLTAVLT
ncbi:unnamed protein product [Rotaria magnacalcarata]|uniref:EF-hand domain-containing protein n=1 Tax=Rotaria magnacalcarata TaxID=392030 RepID=A0A8S2MYA3_9BILA|nr:unnamed protein product [Rotaria magnacalcarata]